MKIKRLFYPPAGHVPTYYFYGRVSHKSQADKGDSIEGQRTRLARYWELRLLVDPQLAGVRFGGEFMEPLAVSASSRPFLRRQAGKQLISVIQPGDHIVVDKFDRIFRNLEDFTIHRRYFDERGIRLHIIDFLGGSLDTGSAFGNLIVNFQALLAEFESDQIGERTRKARAHLRQNGKHSGAAIPWVCERVGGKENKKRGAGGRLRFKPGIRETMARIVRLHDDEGMGWEKITNMLETERCVAEGRPVPVFTELNRNGKWRTFTRDHIIRAYWMEKALHWKGNPDPNEINFMALIEEYKAEHPTTESKKKELDATQIS